MITLKKPDGL